MTHSSFPNELNRKHAKLIASRKIKRYNVKSIIKNCFQLTFYQKQTLYIEHLVDKTPIKTSLAWINK